MAGQENMDLMETKSSESSALANIESSRAVQEVQASLVIAKRFPRDVMAAYNRIMDSCRRKALAENAMYVYPRGGQQITGPSIRLAEAIAQNWGNLDFGIRELSQGNGFSEVEAFAWDKETNTRQTKTFRVPHIRYSKKYGNTELKDPRDIYEIVANQGARRLRACILGIIPGDIIDEAVKQCEETLAGDNSEPIEDRTRKMLQKFKEFGVTQEMIEVRIGHKLSAIIQQELVNLAKIYKSLADGMGKREDYFEVPKVDSTPESEELNEKLRNKSEKTEKPQSPNSASKQRNTAPNKDIDGGPEVTDTAEPAASKQEPDTWPNEAVMKSEHMNIRAKYKTVSDKILETDGHSGLGEVLVKIARVNVTSEVTPKMAEKLMAYFKTME